MNTLKIKNVILGDNIPKICVSIIGKTKSEILRQAENMKNLPIDVVEWRVDWYNDVYNINCVIDVIENLNEILLEKPILFTFRTSKEGGEKSIEDEYYAFLNKEVAKTGFADLIDIEVFKGDSIVKDIIEISHNFNTKIICSNHDFTKTPSKDDIVHRLRKMQDLGADVLKIAVMPKSKSDVLELLSATVIMSEKYANRPIITMSMSRMGAISRLSGEVFGSALTFGSVEKASAPGQIGVEDLDIVLKIINRSI